MTVPAIATYRWPWDQLSVGNAGLTLAIKQALNDPPSSDKFRAQILTNGRWQTTFALPTNNYLDTAKARNLQLSVNGYANRFKVPDFMRLTPGGLAASSFAELIANPYFANGITGYIFQNQDATGTRITSLQKCKVVASGASAPAIGWQLTVTANQFYAFKAYCELGTQASLVMNIGTTPFASDIATSGTASLDGYFEKGFNSGANTTVYVSIAGAAGSAGLYFLVTMFSVQQCLQVDGASQSGGLLNVKTGPNSILSFLKAGDLIEIVNHPYEVMADFDTNGSGKGILEIAPNLRSSPADGQCIISNTCAAICLMKSPMTYPYTPGRFGAFNFEAWEDLLA